MWYQQEIVFVWGFLILRVMGRVDKIGRMALVGMGMENRCGIYDKSCLMVELRSL